MRYRNITITSILIILLIVVTVFFFCFSAYSKSYGYKNALLETNADLQRRKTLIIDAGHGGIDPGAVANGLIEKDLNLAIAKKLSSFLSLSGVDLVLTRTDDTLLGSGDTVRAHKSADLRARLEMLEKTENALLVSIHINKFTSSGVHGLQTFYADDTADSESLAGCIQEAARLLDKDNKRQIKPDDDNIYILSNATKTAVLIECGFISNPDEAKLLSSEEYQSKLAFAIYTGIIKFLQEC